LTFSFVNAIVFTKREHNSNGEHMKENEIKSYIAQHINDLIDIPGVEINKISQPKGRNAQAFDADMVISLEYNKKEMKLIGQVISQMRPVKLEKILSNLRIQEFKSKYSLPILISSFLSKEIRIQCRDEGVGYMDCSGNLYVLGPGLLISRETDRNRFPEKIKAAGFFRDKASRILKKMLSDKDHKWKIRDLKKETGVSLGYISEVIQALEEASFVARSKEGYVKPVRIGELISEWLGFYKFSRQNKIYPYYIDESGPNEIMRQIKKASNNVPTQKYCLTLHAAASIIAPWARYNGVHMYVEGPHQMWEKELGLISAEKDANIFLVEPYYATSVFYDMQTTKNFYPIVSDLQLFLDLYNFPIRGRESAEHLFEKRLKAKLGLPEIP
jgi:hypothetical protein